MAELFIILFTFRSFPVDCTQKYQKIHKFILKISKFPPNFPKICKIITKNRKKSLKFSENSQIYSKILEFSSKFPYNFHKICKMITKNRKKIPKIVRKFTNLFQKSRIFLKISL